MNVQFGGGLATILEPTTGVELHPRCAGNATVLGAADDATVKAAIIKNIGLQIEQAMNVGQTFQQAIAGASLGAAVGAAASAELKTSVQITLLNVTISDDEIAALRGGGPMAVATGATTAAPAVIAPGSRVIATWQDGRSGPATVRSFNGTQYEIAWDGATTTSWVPANAVRPA